MTILFAGGELGAFVGSDSNAIEYTNASGYDSNFSRCAIAAFETAQYVESAAFTATNAVFVHFTTGQADVGGSATTLVALENSGTEVFRLRAQTGMTELQMQYWNGASWANAGSAITTNITNARQTIDLYVSDSELILFLGGSERESASGSFTSITSLDLLRMYGNGPVHQPYTQVIVADEPTIGWRLKTAPATGAGATTDWTGTYAEIDEAVVSDVDFINSATANQVELFTHSATIPTGYTVRGVVVTARAKKGLSGPANIQLALRSSGTTYFSSSQALGLGYGAHVGIWETDPATAADFTSSAIASLQFGVKSIT